MPGPRDPTEASYYRIKNARSARITTAGNIRMDNIKYLKLCGILSAVIVVSLLFIPGLADAIETAMLGFLMVNARA